VKEKLQALLVKARAVLQAFWTKVNSEVSDLWEKDKNFVLLFGVIILGVKFRQILISLIISSSKALFNSTEKKSNALDQKEVDDNADAEKLIQEAKQLPNDETPVTDDWNKNEK
jgi:hypothetical protein